MSRYFLYWFNIKWYLWKKMQLGYAPVSYKLAISEAARPEIAREPPGIQNIFRGYSGGMTIFHYQKQNKTHFPQFQIDAWSIK